MSWLQSIPFLAHLKRRDRDRLARYNIVVAILLAGWFPSILMLVISYTILTNTLESKILHDRQTFVQLIAHLVGDDLSHTGSVIEYYQTQPDVAKLLAGPPGSSAAQQWLAQTFYSHPRIDGMFLTAVDGNLVASIPAITDPESQNFSSALWREGAMGSPDTFVSPVHPRSPDGRMATAIVGAVRTAEGNVAGYLGVSVLVERMGRRLSTIDFADQAACQIVDQNGVPLFGTNFSPNTGPAPAHLSKIIGEIRALKTGSIERDGNLYSFTTVDSTGWITFVEQPKAVAYKPVQDLLDKITIPALWLIAVTAAMAFYAARVARRQAEAARRIEREVIFNEKILANMPSGIALVDPESRHFLQANQAFVDMAKRFGELPEGRDIYEAIYDEVKIAPGEAIERVLAFGAPYQLVEHAFVDRDGMTRFVNVNLLRLQTSEQTVQGVLYLVEDKTRDMTLRQELIGANAAKDQFLALLSHELRNPLSPVIAMVGELEASAGDKPEVRRALEVIRRNVELEARLIDDLLDVTRISKGKLQLSLETASVHEILQRSYEICREEIAAKDLKIEFRLRAEEAYVEGDPARLQQVFWNLVKNSVKFTPAKGRIVIETLNPTPHEIEIRTTDTGIGIEPDQMDRIFNAFEQGQSSITRRFGGLGLGLAISKAMVHAHGGMIKAESSGKNRGATFIVTLATVPAPAAIAALPESKEPRAAAAVEVTPARGTGPRVLVVDDHVDTCTGMKMMLERRGYRVAVAHTADEAVEQTEHQEFDLVISDIGLPDRSGYELMKELSTTRSLRGIALSGFGMENDVSRARAAGFSEHLTKPINFDRLDEAIRMLLTEPEAAVRS
ncbi:MAG TPA: ATP-binding protein [Chthoniobacterales bacterium]|nr:ATP-binding protein [Chthoniobacterales bacterium]